MKALPILQADELIAMGLDYKTADAYYDGTLLLAGQVNVLFDLGPALADNEDFNYLKKNNLHLTWTLEALLKVLPPVYEDYELILGYLKDSTIPFVAYAKAGHGDYCTFTGDSFLDAVYECVKWFLVQGITLNSK